MIRCDLIFESLLVWSTKYQINWAHTQINKQTNIHIQCEWTRKNDGYRDISCCCCCYCAVKKIFYGHTRIFQPNQMCLCVIFIHKNQKWFYYTAAGRHQSQYIYNVRSFLRWIARFNDNNNKKTISGEFDASQWTLSSISLFWSFVSEFPLLTSIFVLSL